MTAVSDSHHNYTSAEVRGKGHYHVIFFSIMEILQTKQTCSSEDFYYRLISSPFKKPTYSEIVLSMYLTPF